jgi:NADP-dependent 3-hydroxy acid dehydrogenase YdfG
MTVQADLDGTAALVTGASSGIGRASARLFAAAGADVALAARRKDRLDAVADDVEAEGSEALVLPTDVTDDAQVAAAVEETVDRFGRLDVVLANAGLGRDYAVREMPTEAYRQMMAVNCDGAFFTARESIPHLIESEGHLIFMASMAGEYPRPANPVYAATKWWTRGLAHSLAGAVGDEGVAVTAINPTEVRTEFGSEDGDPMAETVDPEEGATPEDVAEAVLFAAAQDPPNVVHELDFYRRDKLSHF